MFKIIIDVKISKKENLTLKDKQSIIYTLLNMYSDYGKLLHESTNNIKTGFSFYITKDEKKIYINISDDRFDGLQIKKFILGNKEKQLTINSNIQIKYSNYKITHFNKLLFNNYDTLETLSPIYINEKKENGTYNYQLAINNENIDRISSQILNNIQNYTGYNVTNNDITIIPTFQTRLITGFNKNHVWSTYYIKIFFKSNNTNNKMLNDIKEILMTNFYKSGYTGYFILK